MGEHPRAADTVGINVLAHPLPPVVMGGAVAGFAGTWFTLDAVSGFDENMTAGRGFIALAALIFGRWHPVGAFIAALVFGFAEELQGRLALLNTPLPSELLLMTPYVVTIVVVAGLVGRSGPPRDGQQPTARRPAGDCRPMTADRHTATPRRPPTSTGGRGPPRRRRRRAYVRYSGFRVGAAGLVDDGRVVVGCNVENASYGLTLCAECGLVSALHASGGGRLVAVAVTDPDGGDLSCCGAAASCCSRPAGRAGGQRAPGHEWLPGAFGPDDLDAGEDGLMATDILDVIRTKRDGGTLSDEQVRFFIEGYTAGTIADEQAAALLHGDPAARHGARTSWPTWTQAMIEPGERLDLSGVGRPDRRQALHRRGRRQGVAAAGPAGGGVRGGGPPAVGPGPGPHRRHARQDGGHPRLAGHAQPPTRWWPSSPTSAP